MAVKTTERAEESPTPIHPHRAIAELDLALSNMASLFILFCAFCAFLRLFLFAVRFNDLSQVAA
jgi:hypothetical protein